MLYRIGTKKELLTVEPTLPASVYTDLCTGICFLDYEYGEDRDYLQIGGYAVLVENKEDLAEFKHILDYERHPCEWVLRAGDHCGYISALYILNNDFSITLYLPLAIAPDAILHELEV